MGHWPPLSGIKGPDDGVPNSDLGMGNGAVFVLQAGELLRPKGLLQELEEFGRIA